MGDNLVEGICKNNNKKVRLSKFESYLLYFFIYAFIGWFFETLFAIYNTGHFVKRGFLFGPICPIYGYGALILLLFLRGYKKNSIKLFFMSALIFSALEYFVSFAMEGAFMSHWWDYTDSFFNLNGRISIAYSFVWGIAAILFINHLHPFIKKQLNKRIIKNIPASIQSLIIKVIFSIYAVDTVLSWVAHIPGK